MKKYWTIMLMISSAIVAFNAYLVFTDESTRTSALSLVLIFGGMLPIALMRVVSPMERRYADRKFDRGATLVLGRSIGRTVASSLMFWGLAGGSAIQLAGVENTGSENWFFLLFFVVFAIAMPAMTLWQKIALTISPNGLDYSLFKIGAIPWSDIRSASLERTLLTRFIVLDLRNQEQYLARVKQAWEPRQLRTGKRLSSPFALLTASVDTSPEWLLQVIRARLEPPANEAAAASGALHAHISTPSS
jgi:hypothetical protein